MRLPRVPVLLVATFVALTVSLTFGVRNSPAAPPDPVPTCAPAPCGAWHATDVVLSWYTTPPVAHTNGNCSPGETISDEGSTTWTCAYTNVASPGPADWADDTAVVRIDKSQPTVTGAAASRPPDGNGWYRAPVHIAFSGADGVSGIHSCTAATYSAPDSGAASVTGTCRDFAGNTSGPSAFSLKYDSTGPVVNAGKPARKPDRRGWYTKPVRWSFTGADALSGLADCPAVRYSGPDGGAARVVGACADRAGNITYRGFPIRYDDTAPPPPDVRARGRDRAIRLGIGVASDVRQIRVVRTPGRAGARDSTIFRGRPKNLTDKRVSNHRRYRYTVVATDRAGHRSRNSASAVPKPQLLAPRNGAVLTSPPLLRWSKIVGADYYNVQLLRDGKKVLSAWPTRARLQLKRRWRFEGRVRRMRPGTYKWQVWPGFGSRRAANYGSPIGRGRTFVILEAPPAP